MTKNDRQHKEEKNEQTDKSSILKSLYKEKRGAAAVSHLKTLGSLIIYFLKKLR